METESIIKTIVDILTITDDPFGDQLSTNMENIQLSHFDFRTDAVDMELNEYLNEKKEIVPIDTHTARSKIPAIRAKRRAVIKRLPKEVLVAWLLHIIQHSNVVVRSPSFNYEDGLHPFPANFAWNIEMGNVILYELSPQSVESLRCGPRIDGEPWNDVGMVILASRASCLVTGIRLNLTKEDLAPIFIEYNAILTASNITWDNV
jgi:hypothetical protein